jgi:hypothetical protein
MQTKTSYRLLSIVLAGLLASPALAQNLQGEGKGPIYVNIPLNGAPLLQSFYTRFKDTDHHFGALEVAAQTPQLNKATIFFADKDHDDRYFYNVTFARYFGSIFRRTAPRDFCKGTCTFQVQRPANPAGQVFVLTGFYVYYRGGDHHIDRLSIVERNGSVTVAANDKNDDDPFVVEVRYAYIPRSSLAVVSSRRGSARGGQRVPIERGTPVIRGFTFDFRSEDHHIQEIGVMPLTNGQLEVYYSDKNKDDLFDWSVEYAILR